MKNYILLLSVTLIGAAALTGCGKQEFKKVEFAGTPSAVTARQVPARVDLVVVADNSGSMNAAVDQVSGQVAGMISTMRSKFWDYRIAKTTIINPAPIYKVLVNPDLGGNSLPDGTPNPYPQVLSSSQTWTDPSQFLPLMNGIDGSSNLDYTYQGIINAISTAESAPAGGGTQIGRVSSLSTSSTVQPLLRRNVPLAILVITNGEDYTVDPNHDGSINTTLMQTYANSIKALRDSGTLVHFYPLSADRAYPVNNTFCLSGPAYAGRAYSNMISLGLLPGVSYNICDINSVNNVLTNIANDLSISSESFVRSYYVLPNAAIPSSIKVYKNGVLIGSSTSNGWEYLGGPMSVNTITGIVQNNGTVLPFSSDPQTGYVIQLHGSAQLTGNDTINVEYNKP